MFSPQDKKNCNPLFERMRPDAYKRERSRRYQAKQRSKQGGLGRGQESSSALGDASKRTIPRLPSNAWRYEGASSSTSEEDYDIDSLQELDQLFPSYCSITEKSLASEQRLDAEEPCKLYVSSLAFDADCLAAALSKSEHGEAEVEDLPAWFRATLNKRADLAHRDSIQRNDPASCIVRLSKSKNDHRKLSTSASEERMRISPRRKQEPEPPTELESWLDSNL